MGQPQLLWTTGLCTTVSSSVGLIVGVMSWFNFIQEDDQEVSYLLEKGRALV